MSSEKRVAVMQPYFFPYPAYFQLFARADHVVLFDCVQFPRRGRVHRTEIPSDTAAPSWLTLPISKAPRDALIREIGFAEDATARFRERLRKVDWLADARGARADRVREVLHEPLTGHLVDYLERTIRFTLDLLGVTASMSRSSELNLDRSLKGVERVIAIARRHGATHYLNLPGGRDLYSPDQFERAGLRLEFLPDYSGRHRLLLHSLVQHDLALLREEVMRG